MGYNLNYSSIRDLQTSAMTSVENWKNDCSTISQDISALIADSGFTGAGADKLGTFRKDLGTYDRECNDGLADLKEMMSIVLNAVKQLSDEGIVIPDEYELGSMFDGLTADRLRILLDRSGKFLEENETEIKSTYQHYSDIWNDIIEELREQRIEIQLIIQAIRIIQIVVLLISLKIIR